MKEQCLVCGAVGRPLRKGGTFAVFLSCPRCGLVWLSSMHTLTDQEKHYSEVYYPANYVGRHNRTELFAYRFRLIKEYLSSPPGKLLEVGAASGDFLALLKDAGYTVSGVELSKRAVAEAEKKYGLKLFQGTLEEAKYPSGTFDSIVMYHVLEHAPDPATLLTEACRVLRPGGCLLIEVPNVRSIDALSERLLGSILDYPHHAYAFSRRPLKELAVRAGFRPVAWRWSVPFLAAEVYGRLRQRAVPVRQEGLAPLQDTADGRALFRKARPDGFLKRLCARIVPGMKMTLIAEKP